MSGFKKINKIQSDRIQELAVKISSDDECSEQDKNELIHLLYPKISNYVRKYTKTEFDYEEIMQATFIRIFDKIKCYKKEYGRFTTWSFIIARNESMYHMDRRTGSLPKDYYEISEVYKDLENANTYHLEELSKGERDILIDSLFSDVIKEIDNLEDEKTRSIAKDKIIKRKKIKEIAETHNMNPNTVKTKIRFVYGKIRESMYKSNPELKEQLNEIFN
jgi:RNA polymerase sigma factor (sigma-70 family)